MKEKEIIDKLKELQNNSFEWPGGENLIDFIKKLQKENEELKKPKDNIQVVYGSRNYGKTNSIVKEYISKDKIRELLKEHNIEFAEDTIAMSEQGAFGFMLSLKELLEGE